MRSTRRSYSIAMVMTLIFAIAVLLPNNVISKTSPNVYTVTVGGDLPYPSGDGESMYMGYSPSVLVIHVGDTVVWKALDGPHTVTSENLTADGKSLFDSHPKVSFPLPAFIFGPGGFIPPGGTYVLDTSALTPGTYDVLCSLHQDSRMEAKLTITNQTAPKGYVFPVVTGVSSGNTEVERFIPENITVPRGTEIIFENLSGFEVHTVVSVVTLSNGTRVLGTIFDSSPLILPPGTTWDQVPAVNAEGVAMLGGAMFPTPGMDSFNYTFNDSGTYLYYCKYHALVENGHVAGMVGEVIVLPQYATGSELSAGDSALSGRIGTATAFGVVGTILGVIGIVVAMWKSTSKGKALVA